MQGIAVSAAIGAGFGLIRRKPEAIIVWGALYIGFALGAIALLWPLYEAQLATIPAIVRAGGHGPIPRPDLGAAANLQPLSLLQSVGAMLLSAVIQCAVFRAVLRPDEDRWAYLRLGEAELILFGISFGATIAWVIAFVVMALVGGILVAVLAAMKQAAAAIIVGLVLAGGAIWASVYGGLRLILFGPMLADHGRLELERGLAMTRGRVWPLFVIGVAVVAILIVIQAVLFALIAGAAIAMIAPMVGTGPDGAMAFFSQPPALWLGRLTPLLVGLAVVLIPFYGAAYALLSAPVARAYLDLRGDPAEAF